MNKLTMGSLFDGIGGFVLAGNQVGIGTLWSSEIDPCCEAVTKHHFPNVAQLGDITKIKGAEVPPVDIICGGSPCQDLSVAGKRAGLAGERSGLYMEQIRIIKEMRKATNGRYPRYMVWENVPGALSSNKGEDFNAVLEEAARCAEDGVSIPEPERKNGKIVWKNAGNIVGNGWSIVWRILDAQYWGVPQRRRRIFLVADFGSERAGEILFKPESMLRDSSEGGESREGTAADAEGSVDRGYGDDCLTPWDVQSRRVFSDNGAWPALYGGEGGGHGYALINNKSNVKCLNPSMPQSSRIYDATGIYPALSANENGGQNRQAICLQANGIDRKEENGCNGKGWADNVSYTLNTIDRHAVVFEPKSAFEENWAESKVKNALRAESSKSSHAVVFTQNQREEVRDLNGVAAALAAESGMHQSNYICEPNTTQEVIAIDQQGGKGQCNYAVDKMVPLCADSHGTPHAVCYVDTVAAFMGGQGAKARTIAYSEEVSPSLKSAPSGGNTVPDIVYPTVTGTICSSGAGTSRPAGQCNETDMCVVYGVDCRNATVESELTHTLQAHSAGGTSLNCTPSVIQKLASGAEATGTLMACHAQKQWIGNQEAFSGNYHIVASGKNRKYIIRRLTPLECDRLQGYPDNWSQVTYKGKPMSDSARYRMCGNSVAIPCVVRVLGGIVVQAQD